MLLHEEDLAFAAVSSAPLPHTALERALTRQKCYP
jgi:hypothetical protein